MNLKHLMDLDQLAGVSGLFTRELLCEIVDRTDPQLVMKLYYTVPLMKEYMKHPHNIQKLATRFQWYLRSFTFLDFMHVYETKYYTENSNQYFDREFCAVMAARSGNFSAVKELIQQIEKSGQIRHYDLAVLLRDHSIHSENQELIDYLHREDTMAELKRLIDEQCTDPQDLQDIHRCYQLERRMSDHQFQKYIETCDLLKLFDHLRRVLAFGDLKLLRVLLKRCQLDHLEPEALIPELTKIGYTIFYGAVIGSRGTEIFDLFSPYLGNNDLYRGSICAIYSGNAARIDQYCCHLRKVLEQLNPRELRLRFQEMTKPLISLGADYQLISVVTKHIPESCLGMWEEALVRRIINSMNPPNVNILEYVLETFRPELDVFLGDFPQIQPICLKLLIQHCDVGSEQVMIAINNLKPFCDPKAISDLLSNLVG
ncbi:Hypothetical protein POVR1_LOCUS581 [uncultured virus]|nr:Hypothetical protein POVR1_LOCUS581 [uncultured virus]